MGVTGSSPAEAQSEGDKERRAPSSQPEEEEEEEEEEKEEEEEEEEIDGLDPTYPWLALVERAAEGLTSGQVRTYNINLTRETVLRLSRIPIVAHGLRSRCEVWDIGDRDEDLCAAILQRDRRLQRLRYRSVPSLCSEKYFWSVYFARVLRTVEWTLSTESDIVPPLSLSERWMWLLSIQSAALRTLAFVCCCPTLSATSGREENLAWVWRTMLYISRNDASPADREMHRRTSEIIDKHAAHGAHAIFGALADFIGKPLAQFAMLEVCKNPEQVAVGAHPASGWRFLSHAEEEAGSTRALTPFEGWAVPSMNDLRNIASCSGRLVLLKERQWMCPMLERGVQDHSVDEISPPEHDGRRFVVVELRYDSALHAWAEARRFMVRAK